MDTIFKTGDRVKRGPEWKWGNQDEDDDNLPTNGTVTATYEDGWVRVNWDAGGNFSYPGYKGRFDIILATQMVHIPDSQPPTCNIALAAENIHRVLNLLDPER